MSSHKKSSFFKNLTNVIYLIREEYEIRRDIVSFPHYIVHCVWTEIPIAKKSKCSSRRYVCQ